MRTARGLLVVPFWLSVLIAPATHAQAPAPPDAPPQTPADAPTGPAQEKPLVRAALGEGLIFDSGDGGLKAALRARGQFRAEAGKAEDEDAVAAIYVRRLRASLKASALDGLFDLTIQLSFSPRDLESDNPSPLRDANGTVNLHRDVRLRVGQMKVPFDRQRLVSSSAIAMPERSPVIAALTLDRDLGAYWLSDDLLGLGVLKAQAGVFGGDGRNRINIDTGLLYVARLQLNPLGRFEDLNEVEHDRQAPPRFALAAAIAFNDDSPRTLSTTGTYDLDQRTDFVHGTVDFLGKVAGMHALVEVLARIATETKGHDDAMSAAGGLVQVGALITDHIELVGRVSRTQPLPREWLSVPNPADARASTELRPGVNFYFHEHEAKLQTTVGLNVQDDLTRSVDGQLQLPLFF
jgi:phosphate-selective porin OprO and OprP